ncbi:MAG TPA: YtfJ family protein [Candidatus Nanopelagicales bacterium]|nr:YtfJ family protein [Candidatus Nanopelagicales bacterium]
MTSRSSASAPSRLTRLLAAAALAAALAAHGSALALPAEGEKAPNARVEDADGRQLEMKSLGGKPILIVYEDKDSSAQNQVLKDELAKLARGDRYKSAIALTAVADVSAYNFWPVKGFVKDAIRDESKKAGTTIYCDWDGSFRSRYRLREGVSSVVLVGRDGLVLFAAEGALSADRRSELLKLLRGQVGK